MATSGVSAGMTSRPDEDGSVILEPVVPGVWKAPGARIIDRSGRKRLPIGRDGFLNAMAVGTLVDKTMLIADVLDSGYAATLFCRPRRFGKTLNMTMLRAFLEVPEAGGLSKGEAEAVFAGTDVWEADGGRYRTQQGAYPVVHISFNTVKKLSWQDSLAEIKALVSREYLRHAYLRDEGSPLAPEDVCYFDAVAGGTAPDADFARSLAALCRMLRAYHGTDVVVLVDEYDAPVMAGYTHGYYDEVVGFLKGWLTGALKDGGEALAFACLTGVQRITKESIFSDLNNLYVSTPLGTSFDERYGFTDAEVQALAAYLGHPDCMPEARAWYDGYRFGRVDVYNPWSVISYLNEGCQPGIYWGNTSGNSVVGELVAEADAETLGDVYALLEPDGVVEEPLDLGIVFPDLGIREGAVWSMLYLAGYLTTYDVEDPNDESRFRPLRVPNYEVARLFRNEVVRRFRSQAGGARRLLTLHRALIKGNEEAFEESLASIVQCASSLDLTRESEVHMMMFGLLFGVPGYRDPLSNREAGYGRYDIRLEPDPAAGAAAAAPLGVTGRVPLVTVELKFLRPADAPSGNALEGRLRQLAHVALEQIVERRYDAEVPSASEGSLRWGVAFCGKHVACACERR